MRRAAKAPSRTALVLVHRYVGLAMAGFLAVAGLTGSIIAFQPELDAWLNPELLRVEVRGSTLPLQQLVTAVETAYPDARVTTAHFLDGPGSAQLLWVAPRADPGVSRRYDLHFNQVFVHPATGVILGTRDYGALRFDRAHLLPFIYKLHYSLHLPRPWGDWLMGGVAIAWLLDCFVGFWLTLPARAMKAPGPNRKTWWQRWKPAWRVKRHASTTRLNFDLHRAGGLWMWVVLVTLAVSSVYLNLSQAVFIPVVKLFGAVTAVPEPTLSRRDAPSLHEPINWDQAIEHARGALPLAAHDWRLRWSFHQARQAIYVVSFVEPGHGGRGLRFEDITIDAWSGTRVAGLSYHSGTPADRFIAWQYPLHSGQVAGLAGRLLICAAGLVVTILSVTGVVIWAKKRKRPLKAS